MTLPVHLSGVRSELEEAAKPASVKPYVPVTTQPIADPMERAQQVQTLMQNELQAAGMTCP